MKRYSHIIATLFFFMGVFLMNGQNNTPRFSEMMAKSNEVFTQDHFQMNISYRLYDQHQGGKLIEKDQGVYLKKESYVCSRMFGNTVIQDKDYRLTVDSLGRILHLQKAMNVMTPDFVEGLDSIEQYCDRVDYRKNSQGSHAFLLDFSSWALFQFEKIEIILDPSSNQLQKMVMYYRNEFDPNPMDESVKPYKARMEISFEVTSKKTKSSDLAQLSDFVEKVDGEWQCKSSFTNYRLINQL